MPKRTICIQSAARLSADKCSLLIEKGDRSARIPFEDIWVVILETHYAQITTAALSKLVDNGIGVMLCGSDHMPNGLLLPIGAHSRHAAIVDDQLAISKPLKKRLWQQIVKAKIRNQGAVLRLRGLDEKKMREYEKAVTSGDVDNRESVAASHYFRHVLPEGNRHDGHYSSLLDYGYTVLRAGVGRTAVSGGWLVSRGIHHDNNLNAFNLVDDLIEPFRPVVDLLVLEGEFQDGLTSENKVKLASVFEHLVQTRHGKTSVQAAIELELSSLRQAVLEGDASLLELPQVIALERDSFE